MMVIRRLLATASCQREVRTSTDTLAFVETFSAHPFSLTTRYTVQYNHMLTSNHILFSPALRCEQDLLASKVLIVTSSGSSGSSASSSSSYQIEEVEETFEYSGSEWVCCGGETEVS